MDVATLATALSPDMVENASDMLQLALSCWNIPPKAAAAEMQCSVDAVYAFVKGVRSIPAKGRQALASKNCMTALTVALEGTGLTRLFGYQKVDRDIQSLVVRVKRSDRCVAKILEELPEMLLDKLDREDLTDDELKEITLAAERLIDRSNCTLNLIMELEVRYKLDLTEYLQGKGKTARVATRTA